MASWLKVAEDLLDVVDRRAKLVASDLSDEQSDSQASVSKGREVKSKKLEIKEKVQPRKNVGRIEKNTKSELNQTSQDEFDMKVDKVDDFVNGNFSEVAANQTPEAFSEVFFDAREEIRLSNVALSNAAEIVDFENDNNELIMVPIAENTVETTCSTINDTATVANIEHSPERTSSSLLKGEGPEIMDVCHLGDVCPTGSAVIVDEVSEARCELEKTQKHDNNNNGQGIQKALFLEVSPNTNRHLKNKTRPSPMTVQDQIDDAQGLLKATVSTGHSKEARLTKVCAGLSSRLQEYKSENAQLEELLIAERELCSAYEARIKQLQQDLSSVEAEARRVEKYMDEALAAKNSEIESLVGTVDALKEQLRISEGKVVSLWENMEAVMRSRELTESKMIQALQEELAIAERRVEEERAAHNATKMSAAEREVELEHGAVEASNALSFIQRIADESTSRTAELEHKVALLDVECASLTQELQEMEAHNRRGQKKASEESSQILEVKAWQEEVERARQCQRESENKISLLEAELQKMRVSVAGMKRDAEHYSREEHMELEKRYRELTDLLYHMQTQLEVMSSEKTAASIQFENEIKRLQETRVEAERSGAFRRSSALWEEDTDIKALEYVDFSAVNSPLSVHYRRMAAARVQIQRAVKILDSGAVRATRFLWRYPVARVLLLLYLVFVHLFLMYLLHRLQVYAEDFSSRKAAVSMGLENSSFP